MPPSDSAILERIHVMQTSQAVDGGRIDMLENEKDLLWTAIDKIRDVVTGIRVQVAAIVAGSALVQTLVTAYIVYKITRG